MKFYKDSLGVWWIGNRSYSGPITAIWNESKTHVRLVNNSSAIPFDTLLDADVAHPFKFDGGNFDSQPTPSITGPFKRIKSTGKIYHLDDTGQFVAIDS